MSQLGIVLRKEMREAWNSRRLVWLPLVFVLLGAMQPVSTHFMPQILKLSGGLPAGTVIHIPTPSPGAVFAQAQSQYGVLGLLVLVLAFMGSVSNERQHGVLDLVMVKPVSYTAYILAKWLSALCLTTVALVLGDLAAWYYTLQLIGWLGIGTVVQSAAVYLVWLQLIVTITLWFSVLMNSAIANAGITLTVAAAFSVVAGVLKWPWSPGGLPSHAVSLLMMSKGINIARNGGALIESLGLTTLIIAILIALAISLFKRRTFETSTSV
ncbi:ABC transporter permease [Alicyclobacillus sp. ALC3]|uniref:ABC transporter permease n=1 Tax=Alicyclobacillus sp. ALC3 TaxID=2796143 RepID=UPI002378AF3D|nr:ABC transporter permease subunit [Alicyclobacillus sp. ALC3]WDL98399.1 ABC transporter permease subunit [Alicyclobacillus sp. ALC3]